VEISRMKVNQISTLLASGNVSAEILASLRLDPRIAVTRLIEKYFRQQVVVEKEKARLEQLYEYEKSYYQQGYHKVAGIDEAGRGPLAGPVVVAAVILPVNYFFPGLNDSKKLTAKQRENLFHEITENALAISCVEVSVETIDTINIYQATISGMYQSLKELALAPEAVLIDAVPLKELTIPNESLIKGDQRSASIAAASIIAKVTRDRRMDELEGVYPHYGFSQHKGYGTKEHLAAIEKYGPCPAHRKTFSPINRWGGLL